MEQGRSGKATVPSGIGETVKRVAGRDELGAHVSVAGGVERAPGRAAALDSVSAQIFTKQPNRWAEPACSPDTAAAFLAERCRALRLEYLVTHPGNATDGDMDGGLARNAQAIERALEEAGGDTVVLVETTAGSGRALGATFEELARLREAVRPALRSRVGVCADTCHLWAAGYDLVGDYDGVMARFDDIVGLEWLRLFHLNDSVFGRGSRRDRHANIAQGTLGEGPFRRLVTDDRLLGVPKLLETPKGDDPVGADRENLARLRRFRAES